MNIISYKKNGKTYYKFQIRVGNKVTRRQGFETKNEAIKKYIYLQENYKNKNYNNVKFFDLYIQWLELYKTTVKESTLKKTMTAFEKHILPFFENKYINKITPADCQTFILTLTNYTKGKWIYNQAKRLMKYAVTLELIKFNAFEKVIYPKFKQVEKRVHFLEVSDANKLLEEVKDDIYWSSIFRLLIYGGLRRGELLALMWEDVDFNSKTITVNKTLTIGINYKVIVNEAKTESSNRKILLDNETILLLKKLKLQNASNIIFSNKNGNHKRLSDIQDKLDLITKKLGIKKTRVHDLRHTHATLLFSSGATIKEVQDRLGHSDVKTTMNIYTHIRKDDEKKTIDNFVKLMNL